MFTDLAGGTVQMVHVMQDLQYIHVDSNVHDFVFFPTLATSSTLPERYAISDRRRHGLPTFWLKVMLTIKGAFGFVFPPVSQPSYGWVLVLNRAGVRASPPLLLLLVSPFVHCVRCLGALKTWKCRHFLSSWGVQRRSATRGSFRLRFLWVL